MRDIGRLFRVGKGSAAAASVAALSGEANCVVGEDLTTVFGLHDSAAAHAEGQLPYALFPPLAGGYQARAIHHIHP